MYKSFFITKSMYKSINKLKQKIKPHPWNFLKKDGEIVLVRFLLSYKNRIDQ